MNTQTLIGKTYYRSDYNCPDDISGTITEAALDGNFVYMVVTNTNGSQTVTSLSISVCTELQAVGRLTLNVGTSKNPGLIKFSLQ